MVIYNRFYVYWFRVTMKQSVPYRFKETDLMQNNTARPPRQAVLFCIIFLDFPYLLNVLLTFILLE